MHHALLAFAAVAFAQGDAPMPEPVFPVRSEAYAGSTGCQGSAGQVIL